MTSTYKNDPSAINEDTSQVQQAVRTSGCHLIRFFTSIIFHNFVLDFHKQSGMLLFRNGKIMNIKLKFCGCSVCRHYGMRRSGSKLVTKKIARAARHRWNMLARQGRDDEIGSVSIPPSG